MIQARSQSDDLERLPGPSLTEVFAQASIDHGQFDIAQGAGSTQQVEALKHEADETIADASQFPGGQLADLLARQPISPLRGTIQAADQIHEGGFAGP